VWRTKAHFSILALEWETWNLGKAVNAGAVVDVYTIKNTFASLIGVAVTAAPGVVFGSSLLVKMPLSIWTVVWRFVLSFIFIGYSPMI
jgi:hypothetical protein